MISKTMPVVNPLGMHARAAARFARTASRFQSRIQVTREDRAMDGKSILGLLLLAAGHGTLITVSADGADEHQAMDALSGLVARGFEEPSERAGA